jgi:glycosyltransferase involved in cell wall biosynthesis
MKVLMAAAWGNSLVGGGAYIQLINTRLHLKEFGVAAELFDPWKPLSGGEFDLVHIFGANAATYDLAVRLAERKIPFAVSPVFFSLRSPGYIRFGIRAASVAGRFFRGVWTDYGFIARICSLADAVLPNTNAEAQLIIKGMGVAPARVHVIPNGADERFHTADPAMFRERYGIDDFILYVGNIGAGRKNALQFIKAMQEIDHPAVMIGEVQKNAYAERCIGEARRAGHITILDRMPNDSDMLASAYAACGVFALPSYFETPSIAALEAGLAGAKIVITKYGGTREYFGEFARYVDPFSLRSIRTAITRAMKVPPSDELKRHIHENYLWKNTGEKTAGLYRQILS